GKSIKWRVDHGPKQALVAFDDAWIFITVVGDRPMRRMIRQLLHFGQYRNAVSFQYAFHLIAAAEYAIRQVAQYTDAKSQEHSSCCTDNKGEQALRISGLAWTRSARDHPCF